MRLKNIHESNGGIDKLSEYITNKYFKELDAFFISEGDRYIKLHDIEVKEYYRNMGIGGEILRLIKNYADEVGKYVVLSAGPSKNKKTALDRFYRSNDFKKPGSKRRYDLPQHTHVYRPENIQ